MNKAIASDGTGKKILVIGLSFGNLDKFRAEPGYTFIRIIGREVGLPVDVMIFSGETEAHCAEVLAGGIGPKTKVHVSDRAKG
jgi:hypothetical protein